MDKDLHNVIAEQVLLPFTLGLMDQGSCPERNLLSQSLYLLIQACFLVTAESKGYLTIDLASIGAGPNSSKQSIEQGDFSRLYREVIAQTRLTLPEPDIGIVSDQFFAKGLSNLLKLKDIIRDLPPLWLADLYESLKDCSLGQNPDQEWTWHKTAHKKPSWGAYYTPTFITRYLVEQTVGPIVRQQLEQGEFRGVHILDPSMGCGHFITTALDFLLNTINPYFKGRESALHRLYSETFQLEPPPSVNQAVVRLIASEYLYGIDLDEAAVYVCKLILLLYARVEPVPPSFAQGLRVGNALWGAWADEIPGLRRQRLAELDHSQLKKQYGPVFDQYLQELSPWLSPGFHWELEFPQVFLSEKVGFDAIVANPPYLHVKRAMDANYKEALLKRFSLTKGQWDQGALFIEQSLRRLIDPNGYIGMILPKPFFTAQSFENLRRMILECMNVHSFGPCGVCFPEPNVEANTIVLGSVPAPAVAITRICREQFEVEKTIPAHLLSRLPFCTFSYLVEPEWIEQIVANYQMGNYVPLHTLVTWKRGVEKGKRGTTRRGLPCITGQDLTCYHAIPSTFIQPTDDLVVYKEPSLYKQPEKLLLRRVADRPIAAVDTTGSYVLNTIYVGVTAPSISRHALCAVMNSAFFADLFRQLFNLDDKLFPYLRISQLNQMPIPAKLGTCSRLGEISRKLHSKISPSQKSKLLEEIESIVSRAYDVG